MGLYRRPTDLADALDVLAASPTPPTILAGGTDVYPVRVGRPLLDAAGRTAFSLVVLVRNPETNEFVEFSSFEFTRNLG